MHSVSQLAEVSTHNRIPPASRASISVSGIRCPDDLRERASCIASGISGGRHREPCRSTPNCHVMLSLPAHRGAMRRGGRADAISGRAGGMDGEAMWAESDDTATGGDIHGRTRQRTRTWQTGTASQARYRADCSRMAARTVGSRDGRRRDRETGNRRENRGGRRRGRREAHTTMHRLRMARNMGIPSSDRVFRYRKIGAIVGR